MRPRPIYLRIKIAINIFAINQTGRSTFSSLANFALSPIVSYSFANCVLVYFKFYSSIPLLTTLLCGYFKACALKPLICEVVLKIAEVLRSGAYLAYVSILNASKMPKQPARQRFYTLKRKCIISPSCTMYSLPSIPILPTSRQAFSEPRTT